MKKILKYDNAVRDRGLQAFAMDLDFSDQNVDHIANKEDGSLITTYLDANGAVRLKSKTSLTSTMAVESMEILPRLWVTSTLELYHICHFLEHRGYTVIMEYVSAKNRIVLPYTNCNLVVLGVRNRDTMEMLSYEEMLSEKYYYIGHYAADNVLEKIRSRGEEVAEFVDRIPSMKGIEGFVIRLKDGTMVKCKTDEYVSLHHAKDSVTAPRRLMEVVLQEASDDLRQMFVDDEQALTEIDNMERFVVDLVTHLVKPVERFYDENKDLERKDFAIRGQQELRRDQFSLAMAKYSGKEMDYKAFVAKNHRDYLKNYETTLTTSQED